MPTMQFLALFFSVVTLSQASTENESNSGHGGRRAIKDDPTPDTAVIDPAEVAEFNVHRELSRAVQQSGPCYEGVDAAEMRLDHQLYIRTFDEAIFKATITRLNLSGCRIIDAEVTAQFDFYGAAKANVSELRLLDRGLGTGAMRELVHRRKARPRHVGPALRQYVLSGPPTGKFIVNLEYNAFRVEGDLYEDDVPPARIKDLTATPKANLSADDRPTVTFQWTCGGNHGYDGTAAAFELRGAEDTNDLLTGFHNAPLVDAKSDVVKGSLTPRPAFTVQEAEVAVPYALLKEAVIAGKDATELHFSLRSKSSKNIYSMLSNIATVTVQIPPDIKLPTFTNPPLTSSTSKKEGTNLTLKKTPPPLPATITRRGTTSTQEKEDSNDEKGKDGGGKGSDDTEEDSSGSMTYTVLFAILVVFALTLCLGVVLCMSTREEETPFS